MLRTDKETFLAWCLFVWFLIFFFQKVNCDDGGL